MSLCWTCVGSKGASKKQYLKDTDPKMKLKSVLPQQQTDESAGS